MNPYEQIVKKRQKDVKNEKITGGFGPFSQVKSNEDETYANMKMVLRLFQFLSSESIRLHIKKLC